MNWESLLQQRMTLTLLVSSSSIPGELRGSNRGSMAGVGVGPDISCLEIYKSKNTHIKRSTCIYTQWILQCHIYHTTTGICLQCSPFAVRGRENVCVDEILLPPSQDHEQPPLGK